MKLKIMAISIILLFCAHASGSSAAIAQTRSQANALAGQIEKLIKEDAIGNADEINALEKQLQGNIDSLKQLGQQKIAGELSLRLAQIQNNKKELPGQDDALKRALDENKQLIETLRKEFAEEQKQFHECRSLREKQNEDIKKKDAEIAALKEDLKKMPTATSGAAQSTTEHELAQANEKIKELQKQVMEKIDLQAELDQLRAQSQADVGATIKERLKLAETRANDAEKSEAVAKQEITRLQSNMADQNAELGQLREAVGKRRSDMVKKLKEYDATLKEYDDLIKKYNTEQKPKIKTAFEAIAKINKQEDREDAVEQFLSEFLPDLK